MGEIAVHSLKNLAFVPVIVSLTVAEHSSSAKAEAITLAELDGATGGALAKLVASGELTGKMLESTLLYYPQDLAAQRLLVLGAGKKEKFGTAELRRLAAAAVRTLKSRQVKSLAFLARETDRSAAAAEAITEGLILANFDSDKYKTEKKSTSEIASAALAGWDASSRADADQGLARGRVIGESQNFARELGNEPSNRLTPRILADRAAAMAREAGLAVDVLDEKRIADLKMGALLSVAQGSAEPPRMMITASVRPVALSVLSKPVYIASSAVNTATTPASPMTITSEGAQRSGMERTFMAVIART